MTTIFKGRSSLFLQVNYKNSYSLWKLFFYLLSWHLETKRVIISHRIHGLIILLLEVWIPSFRIHCDLSEFSVWAQPMELATYIHTRTLSLYSHSLCTKVASVDQNCLLQLTDTVDLFFTLLPNPSLEWSTAKHFGRWVYRTVSLILEKNKKTIKQ